MYFCSTESDAIKKSSIKTTSVETNDNSGGVYLNRSDYNHIYSATCPISSNHRYGFCVIQCDSEYFFIRVYQAEDGYNTSFSTGKGQIIYLIYD